MKKYLLTWALVLAFLPLAAQYTHPLYKFRTDVPVLHGSDTLPNAWAGGFNSPQFSTIDLNFDNTPDLFIYDRTHNKILTFLAVQTNGQWQWKYAPEYESTFPKGIYLWAVTVDYDADGLKDLFCYTPGGVQVFRNVSSQATGMQWQQASPLLTFGNNINIYVLASDMAAFADVDNDGDIDVLNAESAKVTWYRNMSIENTGTPGLAPFQKETNHWGGLRECSCGTFVFGTGASCRPAGTAQAGADEVQRHAGNSLLAIDLNGDNVKDLIWGDVGCSFLTGFLNEGTPGSAFFQDYDTIFPGGTTPVNFDIFPAAYYEDVNFDGKKDLIAAPNVFGTTLGDSIVNFQESAWLYTNSSAGPAPLFTYSHSNFLQNGMIDLGDGAASAFADIDGDGDQDMIIGNFYGKTTYGMRATLALYTNTGNSANPVFSLTDSDYLSLGSQKFFNLRPVFADVNGDGKTDLVITTTSFANTSQPFTARIRYCLNNGTAGGPMVLGPMQELTGIADNGGNVPCFADVNNDGLQDLLVGDSSGALKYYRNAGTNAVPDYQLESNAFGGIDGGLYNLKSRLHPIIADADNDGFPDLITADDSGSVRIYPNFRAQGPVLSGAYKLMLNGLLSARDASFLGRNLSVAAADLDGDSLPELIVGNKGGGFIMLSPDSIVDFTITVGSPSPVALQVKLYPNPAQNEVSVESAQPLSVTFLDVLGRPVFASSEQKNLHRIQTGNLNSGVYFVRMESGAGKFLVKRLVISR